MTTDTVKDALPPPSAEGAPSFNRVTRFAKFKYSGFLRHFYAGRIRVSQTLLRIPASTATDELGEEATSGFLTWFLARTDDTFVTGNALLVALRSGLHSAALVPV